MSRVLYVCEEDEVGYVGIGSASRDVYQSVVMCWNVYTYRDQW